MKKIGTVIVDSGHFSIGDPRLEQRITVSAPDGDIPVYSNLNLKSKNMTDRIIRKIVLDYSGNMVHSERNPDNMLKIVGIGILALAGLTWLNRR